jgi:hypothetical protein
MNRSKGGVVREIAFPKLSPEQAPDLYHQPTTNARYRIPWFVWQAVHNGWSIAEKMKLLITPLVRGKAAADFITILNRPYFQP